MIDFRNVRIRGYGAVFEQEIEFAGAREYVARDAFADFLCSDAKVAVNFGMHYLPSIGTVTALFADDFGLGFEATLDCSAHEWLSVPRAVCRQGVDGVSFNMVNSDRNPIRDSQGWIYRISATSIDHLCLTSMPAYAGTAVWLADVSLDDAPPRIRAAAARWEIGVAAWRQAQAAAATAARAARNASVPFASRLAAFAQMRNAATSAMRRGDYRGAIICHAAFSRKGGGMGRQLR